MAGHIWLTNVFRDLLNYCERNGLLETKKSIQDAIQSLAQDNVSEYISHLKLEEHIIDANRK